MSKTALEAVRAAMLELGILQTQEEPSADEASDGLDLLNGMLGAWELDGIRLAHVGLALDDTLPYPSNHYMPVVYNLAVEMATQFGVDLRPDTASKASNGYRNLQNYYLDLQPMSVDDALNSYYAPNRYFS